MVISEFVKTDLAPGYGYSFDRTLASVDLEADIRMLFFLKTLRRDGVEGV